MKRKRRKFTKEFKEEAVKLILEQGYQISEASRNIGIHANLLGAGNVNTKMVREVVLIVVVVLA